MLQEDSNGETTFEIIDKKTEDLSIGEKMTESLSSVSSSASLLPSPGVSNSIPSVSAGNLLSNVSPPSALPSFISTSVSSVNSVMAPTSPPTNLTQFQALPQTQISQPVMSVIPPPTTNVNIESEPFIPTQFSAAIPPSKGVQHGTAQPFKPLSGSFNDDSGGFISWMKGAVASGGLLSKVAEKAKNSVDSMITTLDPQMKEYIYSGGDTDVLVASTQEVKISSIREAFQSVFGKATVEGHSVQVTNIAAQPVGFAAGVKAAEERIQAVFKDQKLQPVPVVAIENFLLEVGEDKWYDLGVLILNDPTRQIMLQTFTQMTPVPTSIITSAQEDTPVDYPLRWSGFAVTVGSLMAKNLQVSHKEWHEALIGVSRREIILLAAKTLANLYKNALGQMQ